MQLSNTQLVMVGTALLGAVAGVVGSFAVLRRRALVGDLFAHAALPGLCLAFLVLGGRHFAGLLLGSFLSGLAGIALVTLVCRWTRTKEDAAIGIVLSTFFGAGVVLLGWIQKQNNLGNRAGLSTYIFGQAASMTWQDLWLIIAVAGVSLMLVCLLYKEFKALSFDPGFAQSQGWPVLALDLTMMAILAVVTVVGLPAVGAVLMAAMLIMPGVSARCWTDRLGRMLVLSALFGALAGWMGTVLSAGWHVAWLGFDPLNFGSGGRNLPTGPVIVLSGTVLLLISILVAPQRGLLARGWQQFRLSRRIARENLLRTLYDLTEPMLPMRREIAVEELLALRSGWTRTQVLRLIRNARLRGDLQGTGAGVRLTEQGLAEASRLTRMHRLWELFLIEGANIAPDHVDRDADSIEHFLSPDLVERLENRLQALPAEQRLPAVPASPHAMDGSAAIGTGQERADG